jgi:hypothetical protein
MKAFGPITPVLRSAGSWRMIRVGGRSHALALGRAILVRGED